jgi:hypothetical protein
MKNPIVYRFSAAMLILVIGLVTGWAPLIGIVGGILIVFGGIYLFFYLPHRGQQNSWPT